MRGIAVHAVHAPRGDDANGRIFFVQHIADLNRRRVGAQHIAVCHVERILHGACGVVLRNVERLEIVEIVFNLGAVCHVKAHAVKQLHHALQGERYGVQAACGLPARWQGYV